MTSNWLQQVPAPALVADIILGLHAVVVAFLVLGLVLIVLGGLCGWQWVRNRWFRLAHLLTIALVVVQTWLGELCPLTIWEQQLRRRAGQAYHEQSFIEYWLAQLIYYDLPWWVFVVSYSIFGLLVVLCMWWLPPRWRKPCSPGPNRSMH